MTSATPSTLIIIGAPRSGTNMLRDVLCRLPGFDTWPCDEINYIWRHGNAHWPSDVLGEQHARPRVASFIQRAFKRRRKAGAGEVLVEKTCANSLRVPFVDRVVEDARYVFIHRDPIDAVASAMKRWNAPFELDYTLAKARYVPLSDVPYYGLRFLWNRVHRLVSGEGRLAFWGPRLDDMDEILQQHSLPGVCAVQWQECVVRSAEAFRSMDPNRFHVVRYETFVEAPTESLQAICGFLGRSPDKETLRRAVGDVRSGSVGKGQRQLSDDAIEAVQALAAPGVKALSLLARVP